MEEKSKIIACETENLSLLWGLDQKASALSSGLVGILFWLPLKIIRFFSRQMSKWKLFLAAGDLVIYCLAATAAVVLVNPQTPPSLLGVLGILLGHWPSFALMGLIYLVVFFAANLYNCPADFRHRKNLAREIIAVGVGSLAVIALDYFHIVAFLGRTLLLVLPPVFTVFLVAWRWGFSASALSEGFKRRVLIVGAGEAGRSIQGVIRRGPGFGLEPVGFIDDDPRKKGTKIDGLQVLGGAPQLLQAIKHLQIDLVVIAITHEKSPDLISALTRLSWNGCEVMDMPGLYGYLEGRVPVEHISDLWLLFNSLGKNKFYYRYVKRLMDISLATAGLICSFPLFIIVLLAVKLNDRGPAFFSQERLGYEGRPFKIFKFRTMVQDAERHGPQWARGSDPRVTRVGRILRQMRLDELPQLINILKGEMSFVGPRPERKVFVAEFQELVPVCRSFNTNGNTGGVMVRSYSEKVPYYSYRLLVKPGLTGWAQVMYSYASSLEQTQEKLEYDLYYIKNLGFFLDLAILLKTFSIILFGRGI